MSAGNWAASEVDGLKQRLKKLEKAIERLEERLAKLEPPNIEKATP